MNRQNRPGRVAAFTAQAAGRAVLAFSRERRRTASSALRWGIPSLDGPDVPGRYPGGVYVIQARTHHGKTRVATHIANEDCLQLSHRAPYDGAMDVSLVVKLEETVEMAEVLRWQDGRVRFRDIANGRGQDEIIAAAAAAHAGDPIVTVGFAAGGAAVLPEGTIVRNRVDVADLFLIVEQLKSEGIRVVSIIIDMLNRMADRHEARELPQRMANISLDVLDLASHTALPIVALAQSVIKGKRGFPDLEDIAGNSDIVRDAEAVLSLWKPNMDAGVKAARRRPDGSYTKGSVIEIDGRKVACTSDMLGLKALKYRHAEFDPETERSIVGRELLLSISNDGLREVNLDALAPPDQETIEFDGGQHEYESAE